MGEWLFALPLLWMTLVIFAAAYLVAAGVCLVVVGLAVNDRGRVFKAFSPQMLTPLWRRLWLACRFCRLADLE